MCKLNINNRNLEEKGGYLRGPEAKSDIINTFE